MKHLQLVQHASSRLNNRLHFRFTENMLPLASIFIKMNGWMDGWMDGWMVIKMDTRCFPCTYTVLLSKICILCPY
jgi:hypothetical protein